MFIKAEKAIPEHRDLISFNGEIYLVLSLLSSRFQDGLLMLKLIIVNYHGPDFKRLQLDAPLRDIRVVQEMMEVDNREHIEHILGSLQ